MTTIRLPAEWETQAGIQFTFPHRQSDWASTYEAAIDCFVECIKAVIRFEKVLLVCENVEEAKSHLAALNFSNIQFVELPSNDTWARDHGGITIETENGLQLLDFQFNAWGLKFAADKDNLLTKQLHKNDIFPNTSLTTFGFILEGGSIESDGKGTVLTTAACLLSPNRNPAYSKSEIEKKLIEFFGLKRVLWLENGFLEGDDTDAHIDTLARFCDEKTIAYVQCEDESDVHYEALQQMEQELKAFKTLNGEPYRLIPLPMSEAVYKEESRLPATYANFLFVNGGLLVPTYGVPQDEVALQIFEDLFPNRTVIGVDCRALIVQHGSLHCITMHFPKGVW